MKQIANFIISVFNIKFIPIITLFFLTFTVSAQEINLVEKPKQLIGFMLGYGDQHIGQVDINVDYDYQLFLFQAQYSIPLSSKPKWNYNLILQPQYNIAKFKHDINTKKINGYEFGVNVGLQVEKKIFKDHLSSYLLLSFGPHYISGAPKRQADGFIFSDNIFIGFHIRLSENLFLNMRTGFRHISNASLSHPNGGVNNLIFGIGFLTL